MTKTTKELDYLTAIKTVFFDIDKAHKVITKSLRDQFAWHAIKGAIEGYLEVKMAKKK